MVFASPNRLYIELDGLSAGLLVVTDPPDPSCEDRPVAGADIVVRNASGDEVARARSADDGTFSYSTVRPIAYTVPDDGTAGDMLRALGRNAWRPAHLHMIINAPGHKPLITEFFPEDDKYLDGDAVFGVRAGLVLPFKKVADRKELPANLAARETLPLPVWTATLDLTLPSA